MKVGIIGTRGIPNNYGGFEQFAEYLAAGLVELGVEVWVYNSHNHPYKENLWNKVNLVHCYDPESKIGVAGQFIYDFNCITDSRKRDFDILLQLGYTSSSIWHKFLPAKTKVVTNMDGLEWQRTKYSKTVRRFLKYAEKLAVKSSNLLIADSEAIKDYLDQSYRVPAKFIPYGADEFTSPDPEILETYKVVPKQYFLLIARMQSDNHIEEIIRGVLKSGSSSPLLVIGNTGNEHGTYLQKKYASDQVRFLGSIFNKDTLNQLRYFSQLYFHGHSAGGTNPSLLEAMAASASICAHDNPFNRSVLGNDAAYFTDETQIAEIINTNQDITVSGLNISNNLDKIRTRYTWDKIIEEYYHAFKTINPEK